MASQENKLFLDLNMSKIDDMALAEGPERVSGLIPMFWDFQKFKWLLLNLGLWWGYLWQSGKAIDA